MIDIYIFDVHHLRDRLSVATHLTMIMIQGSGLKLLGKPVHLRLIDINILLTQIFISSIANQHGSKTMHIVNCYCKRPRYVAKAVSFDHSLNMQ